MRKLIVLLTGILCFHMLSAMILVIDYRVIPLPNQTLRKLIPLATQGSVYLPRVIINDAPRFAYRGMHLDVARHFFTADEVKRYIDILALHNINTFHWHLTDDQGWRIEIKNIRNCPKLAP